MDDILESLIKINKPYGLIFDPSSGIFYCANQGNSEILLIDDTFNISIYCTNTVGACALAYDNDNILYYIIRQIHQENIDTTHM